MIGYDSIRRFQGALSIASIVVALCLAQFTLSAALSIHGLEVRPGDFRITTFASGLNYPLSMARLPDGSLLVTISDGPGFLNSTGKLLRLIDADQNGVSDGPGTVLYSGLTGGLTSVRIGGTLVFVTGQGRGRPITIFRLGATPTTPLSLVGQINVNYPTGAWLHPHSALAVRPTPGQSQSYDLLFQFGSQFNFAISTSTGSISSTNISGANGLLLGDSFYMLTLIDSGTGVSATNLTRVASGLRNPAGFAFQTRTGDLYFQDNGIDGLVDPNEPLSADELNVIRAADIGVGVEFFGYPSNYTAYRTGTVIGGQGIQPLVAFLPQPDPSTGEESEGANDIAFAPPAFPDGLNNGIFLGFHGKFSRGGTNNEENPLVFVNLAVTNYFHFTSAGQPNVGHLDGLLATEDSLFVADLATSGSLDSGTGFGAIYQIKSLVLPSVRVNRAGNQIGLTWSYGTLQQAESVSGQWNDVTNASSPYSVGAGPQPVFFRTRN
jgi:glucose/arabinose dehydrogenase